MNRIILTLLLLLPTLSHSQDLQPACNQETLKITVAPFKVVYYDDRTMRDIFDLNGGRPAYGLTVSRPIVNLNGCNMYIGYDTIRVYVASELKSNKCLFDWVMEHEKKHVAVHKKTLEHIEYRIRRGDLINLRQTGLDEIWRNWYMQVEIDSIDRGKINYLCNHGLVKIFP